MAQRYWKFDFSICGKQVVTVIEAETQTLAELYLPTEVAQLITIERSEEVMPADDDRFVPVPSEQGMESVPSNLGQEQGSDMEASK